MARQPAADPLVARDQLHGGEGISLAFRLFTAHAAEAPKQLRARLLELANYAGSLVAEQAAGKPDFPQIASVMGAFVTEAGRCAAEATTLTWELRESMRPYFNAQLEYSEELHGQLTDHKPARRDVLQATLVTPSAAAEQLGQPETLAELANKLFVPLEPLAPAEAQGPEPVVVVATVRRAE